MIGPRLGCAVPLDHRFDHPPVWQRKRRGVLDGVDNILLAINYAGQVISGLVRCSEGKRGGYKRIPRKVERVACVRGLRLITTTRSYDRELVLFCFVSFPKRQRKRKIKRDATAKTL